MRILFASLALLVPPVCAAAAAPAVPPIAVPVVMPPASTTETPATQAAQLFERDWQWQLRRAPERATALGEHRYNAYLTDTSLAARAQAIEHERAMLAAARAIDRTALSGQDQLSLDLFSADKQRVLAGAALMPFDPQPITAYDGLHVQLPRLVAQMPFMSEADYQTYLARLQTLPAHVDGLIEQLRAGRQAGWTTPKAALASTRCLAALNRSRDSWSWSDSAVRSIARAAASMARSCSIACARAASEVSVRYAL